MERPTIRRAINAAGIVLHTGLGRAALSHAAAQALVEVAAGHSTLDTDVETGRRGSRQSHLEPLLCRFTGAESAFVVNNNAGAVFLTLTALAAGREVIASRGELVEIGGSFRVPYIVSAGGATLVEVGSTNRTRIKDYEDAITENTGIFLKAHPSNFKIVGFTEEVDHEELVALGRERGIPVVSDLGSGAIVDTAEFGAGPTTTMRAAIQAGCDIVTASGDKLLGGPQCGIILGRKDLVQRIAKHPLARALRVDKLTVAALNATLRLYLDPPRARREIPTLRYLARTKDELGSMAERLYQLVMERAGEGIVAELVDEYSQVGGGSLPGENLPTVCLRLKLPTGRGNEDALAKLVRQSDPPIFARIKDGAVLLDPRAMEESEIDETATAIARIAAKAAN